MKQARRIYFFQGLWLNNFFTERDRKIKIFCIVLKNLEWFLCDEYEMDFLTEARMSRIALFSMWSHFIMLIIKKTSPLSIKMQLAWLEGVYSMLG